MSEAPRAEPRPPASRTGRGVASLVGAVVAVIGVAAAALFFLLRPRGAGPELPRSLPQDLDAWIEIPNVARARESLADARGLDVDRGDFSPLRDEVSLSLARALDLPPGRVSTILDHVEGAAWGARLVTVAWPSLTPTLEPVVVLRLDEETAVAPLLTAPTLGPPATLARGVRYDFAPGGTPAAMGWFARDRLLVLGNADIIDDTAEVLEGRQPSLADNESFAATAALLPRRYLGYGFVDPRALTRTDARDLQAKLFARTEPIVGIVSVVDAGLQLHVIGPTSGRWAPDPQLASRPTRGPLTLRARLPASTVAYLAVRTAVDEPGADVERDALRRIRTRDAEAGKWLRRAIRDTEREVGLKLREVLDLAGDEAIFAAVLAPTYRATALPRFPSDFAVVVAVEVGDGDEVEARVRDVKRALGGRNEGYRVAWVDGRRGIDATPDDAVRHPYVRIRTTAEHAFLAVGPEATVDRSWRAFQGEPPRLGDDPAVDAAATALADTPRVRVWVDTGRLLAAAFRANPSRRTDAEALGLPPDVVVRTGPERITSGLTLDWRAEGDGWRFDLHGLNALWPGAAVAHHQRIQALRDEARREAREAVMAVAAAGLQVFDDRRRQVLHPATEDAESHYEVVSTLCGSADPVPAAVPRRRPYVPSAAPGLDFGGGDADRGWRCLGFRPKKPSRFRLGYVAGGPYLTVARGGPDPGPGGFEATAEGDLDGDGVTSLFSVTASRDRDGTLRLHPGVFSVDELE
ncbi:MAG: hypothetical protein AAF715_10775 [Myxococcota bacterium]